MEKILVIDDDPAIQRALCRTFASGGFEVSVAGNGAQAMDVVHAVKPHVVILDLVLPGRTGEDLCREMKQESSGLPVIVLSATTDVAAIVRLLELGANDYVTKPFSPRELLARVRVAVRRLNEAGDKSEACKVGEIEVNFATMELQREGKHGPLTRQEFKMLRFFLENEDRVVSRVELLNKVWGYHCYPTTRAVDTHILHLRQKVENDPCDPAHIRTVHGVGYRFVR